MKLSNSVKRSDRIIKLGSSYDNILSVVANLDYTDLILQDIFSLSFDTLKEDFIHVGVKISNFPDLKKQTTALEIEKRRCRDIIEEGARKISWMRGDPRIEQGSYSS